LREELREKFSGINPKSWGLCKKEGVFSAPFDSLRHYIPFEGNFSQ